jgi:hypothetical protein
MSRRGYISFRTKYAAALRIIGGISYEHAKAMHEEQMISLFQVNHDIQHGVKPIDEHWNLTPMLRPEHKDRFAEDNRVVKKVVRIERANNAAVSRLLARDPSEPAPDRRRRGPSPAR